jgi:peptidyl-prolyl cis-trans isomerase D
VIKLDEIHAAEGPKFEAIKGKLEEEVRKAKAGRVFAQEADDFSNLVYDQPDTLQPVVDKFKLQKQTSGWVTRQGAEPPLLENDKFLRSVFSDNVLKRKQNTEAVEIMPNMLISARVIEHEDAKQRPLEQVNAEIVKILTEQKAIEMARKEGEAMLDKLRKGEDVGVSWSAPQIVSREKREGLHPEAAQAVFRADWAKLPGYAGVEAQGGRYVLYRISKVIDVETVDPAQRKSLVQQLGPVLGQEAFAARVSSLKQKADVKVDEKKLEKAG